MLSLPAQGPWKYNHTGSMQRGFAVSLHMLQPGATWGYRYRSARGGGGGGDHPIVSCLSKGGKFPFLKQLHTRGCSWWLHLVVIASKLWLGSCSQYFCDRQACSSATYLFKGVQKFSASWQLFFFFSPFVLYQSVNLLTAPSVSSDLRQAGWVYWCLYRSFTASSEECRSAGK